MDVVNAEGGLLFSRLLIGGLLGWAAVTVAFGPELLRGLARLRGSRAFSPPAVVQSSETPPAPPSPMS
jgi:hypothetical protein